MNYVYLDENGNPIEYEDIYSDSSMEADEESPQNNGDDKKPKKKKKKRFRKLLKTLVIIILVLMISISFLAYASGYTKTKIESNQYVKFGELESNPLVTNILLIGADGEDGGSQRSDTMMLVSIDFQDKKIELTSFLRDSWVYIPEKEKYAKLNAAYSYGGAQYTIDTLEYNFGVDIDHFLKVDFDMFVNVIDALGGIDVEITDKEASFINRTTRHTVKSGESVHLDGAKALVYARIRKLDSDYMRTFRQRKIISAIIDKAKKSSPVSIINAINQVLPMLETDLNAVEVSYTVLKGGLAALTFDIEQLRIPSDDLMKTGYKGDQWVEIPDIEGCKEAIKEFIY